MVALGLEFIVFTVFVALIFDFFNGVNDAANSIATIVATKVLNPVQAVMLAAAFNFIGPFAFGTAVAKTVGKGIVVSDVVTTELILAGLLGAIAWTWIATHYGIPISVSHSLIGGLIGSALAAAGLGAVEWPTLDASIPALVAMRNGALLGALVGITLVAASRSRSYGAGLFLGVFAGSGLWLAIQIFSGLLQVKGILAVVLFIFYSPLLGFVGGFFLNWLVLWTFRRASPRRMRTWFGRLQIASASFYSLGHGTNDAQKTMGVIAALLFANGLIGSFYIPTWVILVSATAIALGTLIGGYKVVRTMGIRLTHLEPHQGFSAETSSAIGLYFLAQFGVPVSTTHSIAGSIMGVGAVRGKRAVRWEVARTLVGAWILTIPAAAVVAAIGFLVLDFGLGLGR